MKRIPCSASGRPGAPVSLALCLLLMLCLAACGGSASTSAAAPDATSTASPVAKSTTLVAVFSATGATRGVAEKIAAVKGADLYEILPAEPYTPEDLDHSNDSSRTSVEQKDKSFRTEIGSGSIDLSHFDTVFLGYPIWYGQEPRIMDTFVEMYDFSGKTVIPFCTSGSSGIGSTGETLAAYAGTGTWLPGNRFTGSATEEEVRVWLDTLDTAQGTPDAIRARGVLRVGTAGDYQPMSYLDPATKRYVGFDAALAEDLAAALGVELAYVETSWPTLMADTLTGKFDLAICGITITDDRQAQALMSIGYLENGKTVLCRAEDANKYTSLDAIDRPEVRVMENPGGLNEKFARENLPHATLIIHDINQEIPGLVASGEADVMITEVMEAGFYIGQDSRLAAPMIHEPFTHGQLGVLMPKGSEGLLAYVNEFLEKERTSGRLDALAEEYIYRSTGAEALTPAA